MYKTVVSGLVFVAILFMSACGLAENTPVEEAEEEAGVEEVEPTPSPSNIAEEGCLEGKVSNEAGTECIEPKQIHPSKEELGEAQRKQAEEQVRRFEEGETNAPSRVECQIAKAEADLGTAGAQQLVDEWADEKQPSATVKELQAKGMDASEAIKQVSGEITQGLALVEFLANEGYECTPPTPAQLDKTREKPAADPKQLEIQCGPQSNASPAFREKYC